MLRRLFRRVHEDDQVHALYAKIVAQARQPEFYRDGGVPDTPEGRFDLIVLHVVLVLRRLRNDGETGNALAQSLFDVFMADMDGSLRELGVSDLGVPKRVRAMAEAFYGRAAAYDQALDRRDREQLLSALERNLFGGPMPAAGEAMTTYVFECDRVLSQTPAERVSVGDIRWPEGAKDDGD